MLQFEIAKPSLHDIFVRIAKPDRRRPARGRGGGVMSRILTIAQTEFLQLVRTKAFIIGILMVPVLMVAFITFMNYAEDHVDTTDRTVAVIDGTGVLYDGLAAGGREAQPGGRRRRRQEGAALPAAQVDTGRPRDRDAVMVDLSARVQDEGAVRVRRDSRRVSRGRREGRDRRRVDDGDEEEKAMTRTDPAPRFTSTR